MFKKVETIGKRGVKLAKAEIYELINTIISEYQLKRMTTYLCQVAAVSTSGYYRYFSDAAFDARKIRKQQDTAKASIIRKAMKRCGYEKGSRQIKMFLDRSEKYEVMSLKTIQRIMKKFNITCSYRQKSKQKAIMKATQEHHTAPNVLHRQFKTGIARKVLLTDISYLPYYGGKTAYLSAVIDAETTELLGHVVSPSLKIEFVLKTIEQVFGKREFELAEGALINSDQGCHYTSPQFKKLVESKGLIQSMSRRGNCWDNAPIESFFGHLKDNIDLENCRTFKEVKQEVDSYIRYYNNFRYKWNLKKMTPVEYRNHLLAQ
ncbi:MAG: IS3 family transposase [Culicoidibacterales bacterium]